MQYIESENCFILHTSRLVRQLLLIVIIFYLQHAYAG